MLPDDTLFRVFLSPRPITVTLDCQPRGCFLPSKPQCVEILSRIFRYVSALANRHSPGLGNTIHNLMWIWPVNCPTIQPGHGASVHSSLLHIQMFTRRCALSHLFEVIPMSILLDALPSRCPSHRW